MKTKRFFDVLFTLAAALLLLSAAVLAEEMRESVPFLFYNDSAKTMCESVCVDYTTVESTATSWNDGWYVVDGEVGIDGRITVTGNVYLILKDGCTLTAAKGICVSEGNSLSVFAQKDGTGRLTASTDNRTGHAGIGGNVFSCPNGGTVAIHGGVIVSSGSYEGAGIGGGAYGNGATVNIYGGKVSANGGFQACGIGGGCGESVVGGTVNIYGGEVSASGGRSAAGIDGTVNVYGGNVCATGGDHWPGISGALTTFGGNVTANSGEYDGAAIGGSVLLCGGTVNANMSGNGGAGIAGKLDVAEDMRLMDLNDGSVLAKGEGQDWLDLLGNGSVSLCAFDPDKPVPYLAYDGETGEFTEKNREAYQILHKGMSTLTSGCYVVMGVQEYGGLTVNGDVELILADWCDVTVNGGWDAAGIHVGKNASLTVYAQSDGKKTGRLTANGGMNCAAIGGIKKDFVGTITIFGGIIRANGGYNGAGIGAGDFGLGGTTNIYGGVVNAASCDSGAGIGGGHRGGSCTVNIYGGTVNATGGPEYCVGIGAGQFGSESTLYFDEKLLVINNATGERIQKSEGQKWSEAIKCVSVSVLEPEKEPEHTSYRKYENGRFVSEICEEVTYVPCPGADWQYAWYEVDGKLLLDAVTVKGDVSLILKDGCELTVNGGIKVPEGSSLTIYAQSACENTGRLISEANTHFINAGIGGAGAVVIHGGSITAVGGAYGGAGIGGGAYEDTEGNVTIFGGDVEATGGRDGGAGIGSGYYDISYDYDDDTMYYTILDQGTAGTVEIYGGNITARGGYSSAGIGGGYGCDGGNVAIHGGYVNAAGGLNGFEEYVGGIGYGWFDMTGKYFETESSAPVEGGTITIDGGTVLSNGGGGLMPFSLAVTGNAFTVTANGAYAGTGIVTVALYDRENAGRLLDVKVFDLEKAQTPTGSFSQSGYVKAFWWTGFDTMIPLFAPVSETTAE